MIIGFTGEGPTDYGLKGRAIPARKFQRVCISQKMDGGIYYTDADRRDNSAKTEREARKYYESVNNEVKEGLQFEKYRGKYIPMIPLKMIENWLLADSSAYMKIFGKISKQIPAKPELIWGAEDDPESDYPKNLLKRVLNDVSDGEEECNRESFKLIAEAMSVDSGIL